MMKTITLIVAASTLVFATYCGPSPAVETSSTEALRSGRAARISLMPRPPQVLSNSAKILGAKDLYVSDFSKVVALKNGSYEQVATITKGLIEPNGDFVDSAGNLYVADYGVTAVREYKPHAKTPSFSYTAGMADPVDLTVDSKGHVFEADYDGWLVNEYAQGSNTLLNSCSTAGYVEGVAVDMSNDVFVAYNRTLSGRGMIAEYKGGLTGCNSTTTPIVLQYAGGIAIDAKARLIAVDQTANTVDLIAPPYSKISRPLGSGYVSPFHVTLSADNKLAFVTDLYDVVVVGYPSGSTVNVIGSGHGFDLPAGAVDDPNAVYAPRLRPRR